MLYQGGEVAKYAMAERARQAERARIAREVARSKGPSAQSRARTIVVALLTLGLKH